MSSTHPESRTSQASAISERASIPNRPSKKRPPRSFVGAETVNRAADDHAGRVTAAWVRPHLPRWALGPQVGAVMSVLTKRGLLVRVPGAVHESENMGQRNGTRIMPLYTRTREITPEDNLGVRLLLEGA